MTHLAAGAWVLAFTDAAGESTNPLFGVLPFIVLGGVFYFLLIRPQRRRAAEMQSMRRQLEIGDEVRTIGGIYGIVTAMNEDEVTIDAGGGTSLRIVKRAIAERLGELPE